MIYTVKYFKDGMPEWKRKKDPLICRLIYRPVSFVIASICANAGISANAVSYFSIIVAITSAVVFLFGTQISSIVGAILINIWLVLDCVDGNLARSVKKQPFGEFADAISGYILNALICIAMGFSVFKTGGVLFARNSEWIILLGGVASISDSLMRLIYQKFKATLREINDKGISINDSDYHGDHTQVNNIKTRIEETLGFGGVLPVLVLIASLLNWLDIIVVYCAIYYGGACVVVCLQYVLKAIKYESDIEK